MRRHTFATTLIRGGTGLVTVADMLGHARLDTVRTYTHPPPPTSPKPSPCRHKGLRRGSVQDPERRSGSVGRATDRPISESTVAVKVLVIEPTSNTLEASIPAP
jgi:hypothetical protein